MVETPIRYLRSSSHLKLCTLRKKYYVLYLALHPVNKIKPKDITTIRDGIGNDVLRQSEKPVGKLIYSIDTCMRIK